MAIPFNNIIQDLLSGNNLLKQDLALLGLIPPLWGIYDDTGASAVAADNVTGMDFRQDWTLSNYPLEKGAFLTYDKVLTPFDVKMTFSSGGSISNRQALINSVANLNASSPLAAPLSTLSSVIGFVLNTTTSAGTTTPNTLRLYSVVTPEITYPSMSVVHTDYNRTNYNGGAGLISVNVWLTQVAITGTSSLTNSVSPSGMPVSNIGQVQPGITTITLPGPAT